MATETYTEEAKNKYIELFEAFINEEVNKYGNPVYMMRDYEAEQWIKSAQAHAEAVINSTIYSKR